MKTITIFICGAFFGAFIVMNLWQPTLENNSDKKIAQKVQRFNKDFDIQDLDDTSTEDRLDDDLKDMQKQMQRVLKGSGSIFKMMEDSMLDISTGSFGVDIGQIIEKETPESIILEMDVSQIENSSLNIEVKKGLVSIAGEARIEKKDKGSHSNSRQVIVSSFHKTHPVPHGVRASGLVIETKDENTLQLIFPKTK